MRAISAKSTLVVIYSSPTTTGYVFAAGGVARGGDGFLSVTDNKTGETKGAAAPVGGSFWAFLSDAVSSLNGLTLTFKDGARVVVGHVDGTHYEGRGRVLVKSSEHPEIARKLLALPDGDGAFPTDCFNDLCLNGIVGSAGGTLKIIDPVTGSPDKSASTVTVGSVVLTAQCSSYNHWRCSK
jgi:hypothetical protein